MSRFTESYHGNCNRYGSRVNSVRNFQRKLNRQLREKLAAAEAEAAR